MNARKRNQYYPEDSRPEDNKDYVSCTNCRLSHLKIARTGRKEYHGLVPTNELNLDRYCTKLCQVVDIRRANECERYTEQLIYRKL